MTHRFHAVRGTALILALLVLAAVPARAQTFTKVGASNPIVAQGGGPLGSFIGSSWVDTDGDGDLDLFIVQRGLFRNDGGGNFTWLPGAIASQGPATGVTWADVDNDGDLDCYIAGGAPNGSALYLNLGGNVFQKVVTGAIADTLNNLGWAASFGDYDRDGRVDLVLAAALGFNGVTGPNRLFHNEGGSWTRVDTSTVATGLAFYTVPVWSDFDNDGDPDLFIGSGSGGGALVTDNLYRNRAESAPNWFQRYTAAPLGTDLHDGQLYHWVDYDNDGDLDVYLTNFGGNANNLYRNDGGSTFVRLTGAQAGPIVTDVAPSLASVWEDFDNDGDLDCVVTNGSSFAINYYRNEGNGTFTSQSIAGLTTSAGPHWGASAGDYDQDGRVDLYVNGLTTTHGLFHNTTTNSNGWLEVSLTGTVSNRAAIGARVRVRCVIGGQTRWQMRELSSQDSFDGMSSLEAHFGLGDATTVDELIVEWPSGVRTVRTGIAANSRLQLVESDPTAVAVSLAEQTVEPDRVHLAWVLSTADAQVLAVERAGAAGDWSEIAHPTADGAGRVAIDDRGVSPGRRYSYRLVVRDGGSVERLGSVTLETPVRRTLAVRPVGLNPTQGPVRVSFDLANDPSRDAARLELVDASGRRIDSLVIDGGPGAGRTAEFARARSLPAGIYLVRLSQGAAVATAKITVTR